MSTDTTSNLLRDLARSKKFREEFVVAQTKQSIPLQIHDLLKQCGFTQSELAKRAGLTQGTISRAADPEYGNLTINTLVRIAAGFDVAFVGHFVPFSQLLDGLDESGNDIEIPTFEDEFGEPASRDHEAVAHDRTAKLLPFLTRGTKPEAQISLGFSPPAEVIGRIAPDVPLPSNDADQPAPLMELYGRTERA